MPSRPFPSDTLPTCQEIMERLMSEAEDTIRQRLQGMLIPEAAAEVASATAIARV